ncbi:hypothetical protein VTL71DRAFT_3823 [Oculimacula yallundae]|uniref:Uncharacterized protein n=1 Tax=Oculimacula yallundae TaxID=86028 RepID=A0ABR4C452_9HELO
MAQDIFINQGGRRLGDFEAAPNTSDVDLYAEMRQHLVTKRRSQSQMGPTTPPLDQAEDMAAKHSDQPEAGFGHNTTSRQPSAVGSPIKQSNNTISTPFVIDDSPYSTPQAQPRAAKRSASPSLTQNIPSKRQQTRHNTPTQMSPSRPLSHGPAKNLFNFDMDVDEQQGYLGDMENYEGDGGYSHDVYRSGTRSVHDGVRSGSHRVSRPSSARHTPSSRQTPAREHVTSTHQTPSRVNTSSQQHSQSSTRPHRTPQQLPLPNSVLSHRSGSRMAEDSYRQARVSVTSRRGHQQALEDINLDSHSMENEIEVVEDPMARAASLMRAARSQSRPPHRGSTIPPESMREQAQYEQHDILNGSRPAGGATPSHRGVRDDVSHTSVHNHVEQNNRAHRSVSRQQTPKPDRPQRQFVLDRLDESSGDNLEEVDMTSFFSAPQRFQKEQHSRQQSFQPTNQSPFQRGQTAAPEASRLLDYQNRPKTPTPSHRQPQSDQHAVRPPQLDSPIWAPGSGQRIRAPTSRSHTPSHPQNGAFNAFRNEQRSRSRSIAPQTLPQYQNGTTSGLSGEQHSRSRNVTPQTHLQHQNETTHGFNEDRRGRSRSAGPRTPAIERVRNQSRYRTPSRTDRVRSNFYQNERVEASKSRPQTPHNQTRTSIPDDGLDDFVAKEVLETPQPGQSPKTPKRTPQGDVDSDNEVFHTPLEELLRRIQKHPKKAPPIQTGQESLQKISSVIPSGSAFGMAKPKTQKARQREEVTPKKESNSGRGFNKNNKSEVIDLCSPDAPPRSVPMNKRIAPAVKKLLPKKAIDASAMQAKTAKITAQTKRALKEKIAPMDPEEIRQKRAAEIIIDREQKSDQQTRDLALFGEIVHDQAAEDKKAEEARAKGQREREAKMAAMLAKEEADKKIAEVEQKRKQEEAEKRKREKEIEEEQKKLKREADRKRQLAHENREKELLRKAAEEKIRAEREKKAKEEEQRELEKQKAKEKAESIQADAEELAKLKAKQEQAKQQAASLSSAKLPSVPPPKPNEEHDDLFWEVVEGEEESLFVPEAPPIVPVKSKQAGPAATKPSNSSDNKDPVSSMGVYNLEKEAEDMRQRLDLANRVADRLAAPYPKSPAAVTSTQNHAPISRPKPAAPPSKGVTRLVPVAEKSLQIPAAAPEPMPAPKSVVEKIAPQAPRAPASKIDRPPAKSKARPVQQPKITRDIMSDTSRSQSSSISGDIAPSLGYLQTFAANPSLPSIPMGMSYTEFARSQKSTAGSMLPQYKHTVRLISDVERERLEKQHNQKRVRVRDNRRMTEEQKQEMARKAAEKRTEKAREKQIERIREAAEKKGLEISDEEVNSQVEIFLEKRAIDLQKRNETLARRAQDPGHSFGRISSSDETPTAVQQLLRDSDLNNDLSAEELRLIQQRRDKQAARVAHGKIRNNAFDKAAARKSVNDLTDSEESEEDPDPEPEVEVDAETGSGAIQYQQSAEDGERDVSSDVESSSESESEDDSMTSYDMSASFASIAAETNTQIRKKRIEALKLHDLLPESGTHQERMIMIYKVHKLEVTNGHNPNEEDKFEDVTIQQFTSLAEANSCAIDTVRKAVEGREYVKLEACYVGGKYKSAVALDENHEFQISVDGYAVGPSELSPEFIANIPKRMPEKFWDVTQYTYPRPVCKVNEETGKTNTIHGEPEITRHSQFSVLEMANHQACEKLIALFKPAGSSTDHVLHYLEVLKMAREHRDQFDADGECFQAEVDGDTISAWMPYHKIEMIVAPVEIEGPLN